MGRLEFIEDGQNDIYDEKKNYSHLHRLIIAPPAPLHFLEAL
jgi:hypothetical protein